MDITQIVSANLIIILILGLMVGVGIAYVLMIFSRYPAVNVLLFDRGTMVRTKRRRVGDMLVNAGFVQLIFNVNKLYGEDIKNFEFVRIKEVRWYVARLASANTLVPIHFDLEKNIVYDKEAIVSKKLAMEYINLLDEVDKTLDKTNPLIVGILSVLPLAVVICLLAVIVYLVLNFFTTDAKMMIDTMSEISKTLSFIHAQTANATANASTVINYG